MSVENVHLLRIIIICVTAAVEVLLGILVVVSIRKDKKKRKMGYEAASQPQMDMSGMGYEPIPQPQMDMPGMGYEPISQPQMDMPGMGYESIPQPQMDMPGMGYESVPQPQMDMPGMGYQPNPSPQDAYASMPQQGMPYPANPQDEYAGASQPEPAKSWYIEGISGFFNGQRVEINGAISLGRNAEQCQTVYPVDYKGISGKHCELAVTPQGIYLKDCGSSYGTFTDNQGKLSAEQPVPLQEGQTFYLANPNEMFRLIRM